MWWISIPDKKKRKHPEKCKKQQIKEYKYQNLNHRVAQFLHLACQGDGLPLSPRQSRHCPAEVPTSLTALGAGKVENDQQSSMGKSLQTAQIVQ